MAAHSSPKSSRKFSVGAAIAVCVGALVAKFFAVYLVIMAVGISSWLRHSTEAAPFADLALWLMPGETLAMLAGAFLGWKLHGLFSTSAATAEGAPDLPRRSPLWNRWIVGGALCGAASVLVGVFSEIFRSSSSTAILGVLAIPPSLLWAMPLGAGLGWALGKLWSPGRVLSRSLVVLVATLGCAAVVVYLGFPEYAPLTMLQRRQVLERVGEPRVVVGGDAFERIAVSDKAETNRIRYLTGEFENGPGEMIAVADSQGAQFYDPTTLKPRGSLSFSSNGPIWHMVSLLARLNGRLVIVEGGGGYSATEVRELDGRLVWSYRSSSGIPADTLRPVDFNGDGKTAFVAVSRGRLARLDASGREKWSVPRPRGLYFVGIAPKTRSSPAWIVALDYAAEAMTVWDQDGKVIGRSPRGALVDWIVDWPEQRAMVVQAKRGEGPDAPAHAAQGLDRMDEPGT